MNKFRRNIILIGEKILKWVSSDRETESIIGDIEEIYSGTVTSKGRIADTLWCGFQIIKSILNQIYVSIYWSLVMLNNYLKTILRNIFRHKLHSAISIGGLTVAMTVGVLAITWAQYEFSYDRFHRNGQNIYRFITESEDTKFLNLPLPLGPALEDTFPEVLHAVRIMREPSRFESPKVVNFDNVVALVDPSFLTMFDFLLIQGDLETALFDPSSIILTESSARLFFGNEDPIGQTLLARSIKIPLKITGVMKDVPKTSHIQFDMIAPIQILDLWYSDSFPKDYFNKWSIQLLSTYVQLVPGTDIQALEAKISQFIKEKDPQAVYTISLQPLFQVHLYSGDISFSKTPDIKQIRIFLLISLVVLLMAGINYVNLATARSLKRAKEIGVRKINGARRGQIAFQFLCESILLAFIALAGAIVLVLMILPAFQAFSGRELDLSLVPKIPLVLSLLGLTLFTGFTSGLYPAFYVSTFSPVKAFKERYRTSRRSFINLRRSLVAVQIFSSAALIVMTGVFLLQLQFIAKKELGYDPKNIVIVPLHNYQDEQHALSVKNDLLLHTSILSVADGLAPAMSPLVHRVSGDRITWEGKSADANITMDHLFVDADYAKTYGLTIKNGRFFSKESATDRQNFVINEAAVQAMGLEDPIGKIMSFGKIKGQIIGVVRDFNMRTLRAKIIPAVLTNSPFAVLSIRIDPMKTQEAIRYIEDTWKTYYPERTINYTFLEDQLNRMYDDDRKAARIVTLFGGLSLALSCLGLFGLISFMAEQKTKEIGIRKVLGASMPSIIHLMSKEFSALVVLAVVISWPVSFFITKSWLSGFAYRIRLEWWIFAVSGLLVFTFTWVTMSWRAARAAAADPINSLRYE
ncbi:MAG: ABC transporter permease [Candidatus Aminicenantes bacterium]|nr:ABC transporter permease [Candidatus Aminicenantes bacterium]